jgi:hypothetical protein
LPGVPLDGLESHCLLPLLTVRKNFAVHSVKVSIPVVEIGHEKEPG